MVNSRQRRRRGLLVARDEPADGFANFREHRSFLAGLFELRHQLLEPKISWRDGAAGNRQPAHFVVGLYQNRECSWLARLARGDLCSLDCSLPRW